MLNGTFFQFKEGIDLLVFLGSFTFLEKTDCFPVGVYNILLLIWISIKTLMNILVTGNKIQLLWRVAAGVT